MAFEPVFDASSATAFKFENKGDVLEGYYMGSFDYEGDYGPTKRHIFNTKNGAVVVFGQRNLMQTLPSIKPGTMVRITYTDEKITAKGRAPMKVFNFEQDRSERIHVSGVDFTKTDEEFTSSGDDDDSTEETVPANYAAKATVAARGHETPLAANPAATAARQAEVKALLEGKGKNKSA